MMPFWKRRRSQKVSLHVMRSSDMHRVHPLTDFSQSCDKCGEEVGIYPSGQGVIKEHGRKNVTLICNRCQLPGTTFELVPGAVTEPLESMDNPLIPRKKS